MQATWPVLWDGRTSVGSGTAFVDASASRAAPGAPSEWSAEAPVRACRDGACAGAARVNYHRHQHQSHSRIRLGRYLEHALHITVYSWETVVSADEKMGQVSG